MATVSWRLLETWALITCLPKKKKTYIVIHASFARACTFRGLDARIGGVVRVSPLWTIHNWFGVCQNSYLISEFKILNVTDTQITSTCNQEMQNTILYDQHIEPSSRWATAAEDHTVCHYSHLSTWYWGYNCHRLSKFWQYTFIYVYHIFVYCSQ